MNTRKSPFSHVCQNAIVLTFLLATCFSLASAQVKEATPRKEVTLSPGKLKAFAGKYTFQFEPGKDSFLQITAKDGQLLLKEEWSGNEITFRPTSELQFYNKDGSFPLKFTKNSTGTVTHVLAFNRDLWTKVKE